MTAMTPERRAAIINALVADEELYFLGYSGGIDGEVTRDELVAQITEDQIAAYDEFIREFPA